LKEYVAIVRRKRGEAWLRGGGRKREPAGQLDLGSTMLKGVDVWVREREEAASKHGLEKRDSVLVGTENLFNIFK
jgi:hypothetical protein